MPLSCLPVAIRSAAEARMGLARLEQLIKHAGEAGTSQLGHTNADVPSSDSGGNGGECGGAVGSISVKEGVFRWDEPAIEGGESSDGAGNSAGRALSTFRVGLPVCICASLSFSQHGDFSPRFSQRFVALKGCVLFSLYPQQVVLSLYIHSEFCFSLFAQRVVLFSLYPQQVVLLSLYPQRVVLLFWGQ
jgi:hypothetical protein